MQVKDLILKLADCDENAEIQIIQEETLECLDEIWDSKKNTVNKKAGDLYSQDCYSHQWYLLAISPDLRVRF